MYLQGSRRRTSVAGRAIAGLFAVLAMVWVSPETAALPNPAGANPVVEAAPASSTVVQRRRRGRRRRSRGQRKPTPDRIRQIQAALIREGYLSGEPNGVWDDATIDATRRFQEDNGFPATGRPEALTLIKLKLGPPTAGVGAPRERTEVEGAKGAGGGGGRN